MCYDMINDMVFEFSLYYTLHEVLAVGHWLVVQYRYINIYYYIYFT
jgi:hypothetical protein